MTNLGARRFVRHGLFLCTLCGAVYGSQQGKGSVAVTEDISWLVWGLQCVQSTVLFTWWMCRLPFLPVIWTTAWLWQRLVMAPVLMAMEATSLMYPVLVYCLAAGMCGVIIGGCGGFALEAMSSALLNATWGKTADDKPLDTSFDTMYDRENDKGDGKDDDYDDDASSYWGRPSLDSPTSSFYRFSMDQGSRSRPISFYDDLPENWEGDDQDPEQIASYLRQRRRRLNEQPSREPNASSTSIEAF
ncbi:hypothetical protein BC940DRAFT_306870 [Gongronella butleri]|nr:hypothetical protein BC940DRAFT_306870 [Gongronella butleri]